MLLTVCVYTVFMVLLVMVTVVDLRTLRIPDAAVAVLFVVWFIWRAIIHFGGITTAPVTFSQGVIGAVMLGGGLLLVTAGYEALAHKRAMGGGDIKLLAAVGLYLGIVGGLFCLLVACAASLLLSFALPRLRWVPPCDEEELAAFNDVDGDGVPDPARPVVLKNVPFGPAIMVGAVSAVLVALASGSVALV